MGLHVSVDDVLKQKFITAAKANRTDASALVRQYMADYVAEHEQATEQQPSKRQTYVTLYNAGYALQDKLGRDRYRIAGELLKLISDDIGQFVTRALTLSVEHGTPAPDSLLLSRDDATYAQAFVAGIIGENRIDE